MGAIFISYRRDDCQGEAGRLSDSLTKVFGDSKVFLDVEGIPAGQDFRQAIEQQVASCDVLLGIHLCRQLSSRSPLKNDHLMKDNCF